jgi:hypothetical protein
MGSLRGARPGGKVGKNGGTEMLSTEKIARSVASDWSSSSCEKLLVAVHVWSWRFLGLGEIGVLGMEPRGVYGVFLA